MADLRATIESVFRQESGIIIAGLIRVCGSFDLAEEAMQEAFTTALTHWPASGVPQNPAAWITTVARRKIVDFVRRDRVRQEKHDRLLKETDTATRPEDPVDADSMNFPDDRLRLIFTCCHPALNVEAQIALTLRTLGGLATPEIARAFLLPEATLAQRQDIAALDDALNALPVAWRECLILREVEALSYKEIARIMDIPIGTVMSRLSRARQALQREVFAEGALPGNPSMRNIRADIG